MNYLRLDTETMAVLRRTVEALERIADSLEVESGPIEGLDEATTVWGRQEAVVEICCSICGVEWPRNEAGEFEKACKCEGAVPVPKLELPSEPINHEVTRSGEDASLEDRAEEEMDLMDREAEEKAEFEAIKEMER